MKIETKILLINNGKEFDTGSICRSRKDLTTLSLDEAIARFESGKRVYFIYQNERIYHCNCRKVAKDLGYIKDHYNFYNEVCGY